MPSMDMESNQMTKENELQAIKAEFPSLTRFDGGLAIELTSNEYDHLIEEIWQARKEQKEKEKAKAETEAKREAALSKLAALGLDTDDLKALGL